MIRVTKDIAIPDSEIQLEFVRAPGPGGQHVNRAATAVQLRFDVASSPSLPNDVRRRLIRLAGKRLTEDDVLIIEAKRFRSQERNRQDAINRLIKLVRQATKRPKVRRRTKPTRASREQRLKEKRQRSEAKRLRRSPTEERW